MENKWSLSIDKGKRLYIKICKKTLNGLIYWKRNIYIWYSLITNLFESLKIKFLLEYFFKY